jgi:hypothetical protein
MGFTNMLREAGRTEWGSYTNMTELKQEILEAEKNWFKLENTKKKGVSSKKPQVSRVRHIKKPVTPVSENQSEQKQETSTNKVKW